MRKTAIYRSEYFLDHQPGYDHPESPERLRIIYDELDRDNLGAPFLYPSFEAASTDIIGLNHTVRLVRRISETEGRSHDFLDADTRTSEHSFRAACLAVGALLDGIRRMDSGEIDNGFCLVRPPGHHAEKDHAMGFCLFNNVAIAARWALRELGLNRIMIIDWDLHHGNGTQHSFYDSDQVLYLSTHQYPYYPGTGAALETGEGKGTGYTVNIPLPGGQGDAEFARIFNEIVAPIARDFAPELLLVSCGFDIYDGDPLGAMRVTPAGFAYMTRVVQNVAEEVCDGRLLITLEGGYNLTGMRDGALAVLAELLGERLNTGLPIHLAEEHARELAAASSSCAPLEQAKTVASAHWNIL